VYPIKNKTVLEKSLYDECFMEVDSEIEKETINESIDKKITVFGKLPRVSIPTPHGKSYSPDFAYVVDDAGEETLYFVVETKGVDSLQDVSMTENLKIKSAEKFFETLREKGVNIHYKTKINSDTLSDMISSITHDS